MKAVIEGIPVEMSVDEFIDFRKRENRSKQNPPELSYEGTLFPNGFPEPEKENGSGSRHRRHAKARFPLYSSFPIIVHCDGWTDGRYESINHFAATLRTLGEKASASRICEAIHAGTLYHGKYKIEFVK